MRITDAPFSAGEAMLIRRMLTTGASVQCPRCIAALAESESVTHEGALVVRCRLMRCPECRRMMTLTE